MDKKPALIVWISLFLISFKKLAVLQEEFVSNIGEWQSVQLKLLYILDQAQIRGIKPMHTMIERHKKYINTGTSQMWLLVTTNTQFFLSNSIEMVCHCFLTACFSNFQSSLKLLLVGRGRSFTIGQELIRDRNDVAQMHPWRNLRKIP